MKKQHSGGGRTHREIPVRTGIPARGHNEERVAQRGIAVDPKAVAERSKPTPTGGGQILGNEKALDVGGGGPGTGRTVMKSGAQGTHGPTNPGSPRPGGELFPGWPEKR